MLQIRLIMLLSCVCEHYEKIRCNVEITLSILATNSEQRFQGLVAKLATYLV